MRGRKAFGIGKSGLFPQCVQKQSRTFETEAHKQNGVSLKKPFHLEEQIFTERHSSTTHKSRGGCLNNVSAQQSVHSFLICHRYGSCHHVLYLLHIHRLPNLVKACPAHSHLFIGSECWPGGTGTRTGTVSLLRGPRGGVGADAQPRGHLETNVMRLRLLEKNASVICAKVAKTVSFSMGCGHFFDDFSASV